MSYAEIASKGPKQTPEEVSAGQLAKAVPLHTLYAILTVRRHQAAAPPVPEIVPTETSTASLVDVDVPSVRTVPSDFLEQDIQTETQAARIDREEEAIEEKARAEADLAKKKVSAKAHKADSWLTKQFSALSDNGANALVIGNLVAVVGLSAYLGYKAIGLYERGKLSWQNIGLGLGIVGVVGAVEGVLGG